MKRYKFANQEGTAVNDMENNSFGIMTCHWQWAEYQKWLSQGNITEPFETPAEAKGRAVENKKAELTQALLAVEKQTISFSINGTAHNYFTDDITRRYLLDVATMVFILALSNSDPIPTEGGVWKTAETQADGFTPIYVSMTVKNFKDFCTAFFNRGKGIFTKKEQKTIEIMAKLHDPSATAEDINNIVIDI